MLRLFNLGWGDLSLSHVVQLRKYKFLTKCGFSGNQYVNMFGKSGTVKMLFQNNLTDAVPVNVFRHSLFISHSRM